MANRAALIAITIGLLVFSSVSAAGTRRTLTRSAANLAAARFDAAHELALARLPADAKRVAGDESIGAWFTGTRLGGPGTPNLVDRHAFWHVSADPGQLYAWIMAHPPHDSVLAGCSCDGNSPFYVTYAFPSQRGSVDQRALQIGVAPAQSGGAAVRADGQAVWLVPRPSWLRIPGATRVTIRISTPRSSGATTFSSGHRLKAITRLIDRLPLEQPAYDGCSFPNSLAVTLVFASRADVVARVDDDDEGCGLINVSIRGHPMERLTDGHRLAELVRRLGGISSCRSRRRSTACLPPTTVL